jgi:uncharacterized protein
VNPGSAPVARPHLLGLLAGLFLAAGLVGAALVFARTWLRVAEAEAIAVTGSARKNVTADLIVWRGQVTAEAETLVAARQGLKRDADRVLAFIREAGLTNALLSPIAITELTVRREGETGPARTVGYRLAHTVEVRSGDLDRVLALDRATAALVEQGILFTSQPPDFIWTLAGEAKVEMLAEATRDARARADQVVGQGARRVARLRSARMGVFQVTPLYSTQTSWDGLNDTTSRDKTVTAVVTATFALEP